MLPEIKRLWVILLGGITFQAMAADRPIQYPDYDSALTFSGSLVQSTRSSHNPGWGIAGESVYSRDYFNTGGGLKYFPEAGYHPVFNAFVGTGYKQYAQLQAGWGTEGAVYRLRSEISLPFLWKLGQNIVNQNIRLPGDLDYYPNNRFVVTVVVEKYDREEPLDNIAIGLGLRY